MMKESFIKKLARLRADEIFTAEYYQNVTDSWYLDEKFRFEDLKVGQENRKPNEKEADIYMKHLNSFFEEYKDKFYGDALAQNAYGECINHFREILHIINAANITYHQFNIDEETIKEIKKIGNIFVKKHNEFCKDGKSGEDNQ